MILFYYSLCKYNPQSSLTYAGTKYINLVELAAIWSQQTKEM